MLEHDYFDTEILYHGQINQRTDDHLRGDRDLLNTPDAVDTAVEQIKRDCEIDGT